MDFLFSVENSEWQTFCMYDISHDNNLVPGDALWVEEADVGRVEGTDQVDPGANVCLLVNPANIRTNLGNKKSEVVSV